jgi:hypothetical protein
MSRTRVIIPFLALALSALAWAACKQKEGDRCQIDSDCEDGLVCNKATQQCSRSGGGGIDATIPIDAPDAATGLDAPIDAMIDAPDAPL